MIPLLQLPLPYEEMWHPAVILGCLGLLLFGQGWLITRSISFGERLAKVEALVGNHYHTRFEHLRKALGIDYADEEEVDGLIRGSDPNRLEARGRLFKRSR